MIFGYMSSESTGREPYYLFGLSHENLKRLKAGQPIMFSMRERGADADGRVIICAGRTEESLAKDIQDIIDPDTTIVDRRTP